MATINYKDSSGNWVKIPTGVTVDSALSSTSENPVQNKVINSALNEKYTKPTGGIPKTDLASAVQTSLGKVIVLFNQYLIIMSLIQLMLLIIGTVWQKSGLIQQITICISEQMETNREVK